jgi:RNA polymerase sigma-70 factor (ECF subfamily)
MDSNRVLVFESTVMDMIIRTVAFEDLYRLEYPGLVAVASAMTGDNRDSEDLVQDTMVKAFIQWDRVSGLDRPGAWCHRVLINACRSKLRRRRREHRFVARVRRDDLVSAGPSADVVAFWEVVRSMPTRPRMVVTLFYAGDHTTAEIATILDCPEGTVRSDLSRARVVLADQLRC